MTADQLAGHKGVWVYVEQHAGEAQAVSWELLGAARRLAQDLQTDVSAAVLGWRCDSVATEAFEMGADRVYIIDDPALEPYRLETHAEGLRLLIEKHRPEVLLVGATWVGRELAASVATAVGTGLTADTTELSIDKERRLLEATRPTFGGKQMATIVCERARPQMATVRPHVLSMPERAPGRKGEIVREAFPLREAELLTRLLERMRGDRRGHPLDEAAVIVAGGRGVGSRQNFALLHELAEVLGGVVAGSRAAVEAGWIGREFQVGQTGRTVRPRLYIAVGISGAVQHVVGIQGAGTIVAINSDPNAPIFAAADYGVIGDATRVVPVLTEELRMRMQQPALIR